MKLSINLKNVIRVLLLGFVLAGCMTKNDDARPETVITDYDSLKAREYGADEYGMKTYVMAFLRRGPNRNMTPEAAAELQRGHLKNIHEMAVNGKLVLAGPFLDDGELRGIYIFNVGSVSEAEALTRSDPAIQAGSLTMELKEWYGPAALIDVNQINPGYARKSITEHE